MRPLSSLTLIALLFTLAACSNATEPSGEPSAQSEPQSTQPVETASAQPAEPSSEQPSEPVPAEQSEPPTEVKQISYPIAGGHTLSMVVNYRNRVSAGLNGLDFTHQYCYETLSDNTGISMEFKLISEVTFSEQINIMFTSAD